MIEQEQARRNRNYTEPVLYPLRIYTADEYFFVNMYYFKPILLCKSNIAKQDFCQFFNVICDGSRFWIYMAIQNFRQIPKTQPNPDYSALVEHLRRLKLNSVVGVN